MKKISLALITLLSLASCQQAALDERPNVVFMVCDDLNDYIGAFGGHPQAMTPNIDLMAESGVKFINAQSNVPVCSPSGIAF
jgi:arylsulfatase A-like enzyme